MTEVDLKTLVSSRVSTDQPPESFWLSKDSEYDWFDRNAVYERKESTKGISSSNPHPLVHPSSNSNSQRLKSKASLFALPKTQKAAFVESKRRTSKPASMRLFPKRSGSAGKSAVQVAEPGSPKVSCMGRVRSKRCRRRSNSGKRDEPVEKLSGERKTGFYYKLMGIFRFKKGGKPGRSGSRKVEVVEEEERVVVEPRRSVSVNPGLGGMTRFASGRRSGSWTGEDFNVEKF